MACYLGIDAGTQSIKGILIDPEKGIVSPSVSVHFGRELGQYASPDGFLTGGDLLVHHADPQMWLDALDLLLQKMQRSGLPMHDIEGISGSGQQHGTVYLTADFFTVLADLSPRQTLAEQLKNTYSRKTAPIWMDISTGKECEKLRQKFGSCRLRKITGSDAAERFSAAQIMKFASCEPEKYQQTAVIHLVSSFLGSVFAGESIPIDYGDGAGMNLLDLSALDWHREIADFTAPGLLNKLPPCVKSNTVAGKLSPYFSKYGLRPGIPVSVWSGDNPCSLIGCGGYAPGTAVISLGTSDTFFGSLKDLSDAPESYGHIFGNPAGGFMHLLCFANGSLTRETVRERYQFTRQDFEDAIKNSEPGKYQLLPFLFPESTPQVEKCGIVGNFDPEKITPRELIRALTESQFLTMRYHAGSAAQVSDCIRLTGGASESLQLRQLVADIFQVPVETGNFSEAPALGAAMRAANSCGNYSFAMLSEKFCSAAGRIEPHRNLVSASDQALKRFAELIRNFTGKS